MGKVIFLDIDGTLVTYENKIPETAVTAIRKARTAGNRVYLCTGRSEAEVYDELWDIGVDGLIGANGSYVKDGDEVVLWNHLSGDDCRHIVDWLHARGLEFYLEANSGLYGSEKFETAAEPSIKAYVGRKGKDNRHTKVRDAFPDMIFGADLFRDDVNKISFLLKSYQDYLDAEKEFQGFKVGTWGGAGETALFGDVGVKDMDKGVSVDALLRHIGADLKDTYAFGDAKVDIPMLEKCAVGIAMGNGGPEIKAAADYVTDDVEKDGLYHAFEHFGLMG